MKSDVHNRPSWENYFMDITCLVAKRSTCTRRAVGAVIVKDRRLLATGYNGAPSHVRHCAEVGCLREQLNVPSGERHELCRGIHAEQNAIIQAAYHGIPIGQKRIINWEWLIMKYENLTLPNKPGVPPSISGPTLRTRTPTLG